MLITFVILSMLAGSALSGLCDRLRTVHCKYCPTKARLATKCKYFCQTSCGVDEETMTHLRIFIELFGFKPDGEQLECMKRYIPSYRECIKIMRGPQAALLMKRYGITRAEDCIRVFQDIVSDKCIKEHEDNHDFNR